MINSALQFLTDSNFQKVLLVIGVIFTFLGISGQTWKKENLGCFPRLVFSVLGLAMLAGAFIGYFENKDRIITGSETPASYAGSGNTKGRPGPTNSGGNSGGSSGDHKAGRDDYSHSTNVYGDFATIIQRNNSNDYITYEGNRVSMRNSNNNIEYYITNEAGTVIVIDSALLASKGVRVNLNQPDLEQDEVYDKIEEWLSGSWSFKSSILNYNGTITINEDGTIWSCSSGDSGDACIDGTWQLKSEGGGASKRYFLYLHHGQAKRYNPYSNTMLTVSFSPNYLWRSKIVGLYVGESDPSVTMKKQ